MEKIDEIVEQAGNFCSTFTSVKSWEILGGSLNGTTLSIEKGYLKTAENSTQFSLNIRLMGELGKTGSVSITKMSIPFIKTSITNAVSLMKGSLPNHDFKCLASPPDKYPNIKTPYDTRLKDLTVDDTSDIIDSFMNIKSQLIQE